MEFLNQYRQKSNDKGINKKNFPNLPPEVYQRADTLFALSHEELAIGMAQAEWNFSSALDELQSIQQIKG